MKKLTDRKWMPFKLGDVCTIAKGVRLTKANMKPGNRPFVGATSSNNGITNWVSNTNDSLDRNVLGVNYNGSVGYAFYHPYECVFTDDVKRLHLKNHKDGRRVLQFFAVAIAQQAKSHDYGYKFNGERMERQNIMLPVNAKGKPDYAFMEAYIRERENALLARYSAFVKGRTIPCMGGGKAFSAVCWKAFSVGEIFKNYHGVRLTKANRKIGNLPLLTAGAANNGIAEFISTNTMPLHSHFISVDMFGTSFVHPYTATGDDNIYFFENPNLSDAVKHFISVCINKQAIKYSYGKQFRQSNADRLKVMLPATSDGSPDFAYMEAYGRKIVHERLAKYLAYRAAV